MPRTATLIPDEPTAPDLPVAAVPAQLTRYEDDAFAWSREQAALLRAGRLDRLDLANIAEEIAAVGRSDLKELRSHLALVMMHLLKWDYQPERRSRSWLATIRTHRGDAQITLEDSPSLKHALPDILATAWRIARREAMNETGLPSRTFPADNPWTFDEVMTRPITLDNETA